MTKIVKLETENIKRINSVEMDVSKTGELVIVSGENGEGKTSLLDSIAYAIGGKKLCPEVPIRKGAKQGRVKVTLDNGLIAERLFRASGSTEIKVTGAAGSPQAILDKLYNTLTFDPLEWTRMKADKQIKVLKQTAGIDTAKIDAEYQTVFAERTIQARLHKEADAQFKGMKIPEVTADAPKIDTADINKQIDELEEKIKKLRAQITEANTYNNSIDEAAYYEEFAAGVKAKFEVWEKLDAKVKSLVVKKQKLIADAKYPVPGLGFDDGGVTLNGLPFSQASQAEQLRVSVAMGLAGNPDLRVMLIRDGSLLDKKSRQILRDLAVKHDAQFWIEVVGDESAEVAVIIQDGYAKEPSDGK